MHMHNMHMRMHATCTCTRLPSAHLLRRHMQLFVAPPQCRAVRSVEYVVGVCEEDERARVQRGQGLGFGWGLGLGLGLELLVAAAVLVAKAEEREGHPVQQRHLQRVAQHRRGLGRVSENDHTWLRRARRARCTRYARYGCFCCGSCGCGGCGSGGLGACAHAGGQRALTEPACIICLELRLRNGLQGQPTGRQPRRSAGAVVAVAPQQHEVLALLA
eukprot:scaffold28770_cov64-Phaeocystis_antarctica.AAC.1